ncbi:hypothetical protein [Calothrix sp. UHCC 0171]|uniref:hypothetical protein n=1 Tax=Calothrix sp. UHCC 0171 TaxID=3110245 RepID=UPI002B1F4AA2|nr:hypothetical protein [Calothrix sp. UHCC 0171]MEA5570150.1 hypothetical protein [Calothrix sp. UHCC 0171]
MVHTYEVFVDICESADVSNNRYNNTFQRGTERYEIATESRDKLDEMAFSQARSDHPKGIEFDVRVTRIIK